MRKAFSNILLKSPRYRKTLLTLSAFILGMCMLAIGLSFFLTERNRNRMTPEKYQAEKQRFNQIVIQQTALAFFVVVSIFGISHFKKKTLIFLDNDGIELKTAFKSIAIPWEHIKDVKVKMPGTTLERCQVRNNRNQKILFTAFFVDESEGYTITADNILDSHGIPVSHSLKKNRLYKEVTRRFERQSVQSARHKNEQEQKQTHEQG